MSGRVQRLWRYPVKSMGGEACERLALALAGVAGDREYTIRTSDGRLGSGKNTRRFRQVDGLLALRANARAAAPPEIRLPDGRTIAANDPGIDRMLSGILGQPVTLTRAAGAGHVDAAPVHLLTTASLAWLRTRLPGAAIDERRFRPNIVIDWPGDVAVEQGWLGRTLVVGGSVRLRVLAPTERCRMVTLAQDDVPQDPGVLRVLAEAADAVFGVYAEVREPGTIGIGDAVVLE